MALNKQIVLVIITIMAIIGLMGDNVPGIHEYADESDTNTEQDIKQTHIP
jgi:hypothetical protein